ncbi:hypothetical protein A2X44_03765 [candidate division CPR3 bacterium GWF2_35_18]|uniref:Acetylornithine deacetylase or succinyl-diaminopimelate desuccinylase n=1 Tax=candidate division CPR3 bacterium GW2011_GWF2_35_18 TaxID=1618350 RepID=A0A0G0E330_UNCC3|nr:MAG: Acetylornithine deacetylase or succinyl-diaminopimelate desuccinylase [candidate division CPR3 bacterium GW2011_GWF2_35_18]OGB63128.1 MAG: hypothetical protein A2X44_03765 [candidate division CPR3 bacterium GWF2_35_18]OGB64058.1 MAG: hypothetical protein A2250_04625 [candidate division CPR3 bacterium RIFOXYA2_FULL_35_13]OGB78224.1 MAG: hypothetical protein A2296_02110 [candidate division CPR3 bacterium RIFOXYB2_FULL_35_8]OGB79992.1 MAG: hypothetical protein A2011_02915 [candidate divisi
MDGKLFNQIKKYEPQMISFLQEMVKIPSYDTQGANALADFVAQKLTVLNYDSHLLGRGADYSVLYYPFTGKGKTLWLSAPLDTARPGTESDWKSPPFSGVIEDRKLFGRGSADCKATIAFYIYGFKALHEVYPNLKGQVVVAFDGGEHNGDFSGLKSILDEGIKADASLIGYPNDKEIFIGSRGYVRIKIAVYGKSAHTGSRKHLGINAITKAIPLLQQLANHQLKYHKNPLFPFGPKLTISIVNGGSAINVVPDRCEISLDIRTVPSQKSEEVVSEIRALIEEVKSKQTDFHYEFSLLGAEEPYLSDQNANIIQIFQKNAQETLNKKIPLSVCGPANDGNVLASKLKIPVICGFGCRFENLHGKDECVYLDDLIPTAYTYMKTVKDFLES